MLGEVAPKCLSAAISLVPGAPNSKWEGTQHRGYFDRATGPNFAASDAFSLLALGHQVSAPHGAQSGLRGTEPGFVYLHWPPRWPRGEPFTPDSCDGASRICDAGRRQSGSAGPPPDATATRGRAAILPWAPRGSREEFCGQCMEEARVQCSLGE